MRWPPPDTDRNRIRILLRVQAVIYVLGAAYFLAFALASKALVPWLIFTAFVAAAIVVGAALLVLREHRRQAEPGTSSPQGT